MNLDITKKDGQFFSQLIYRLNLCSTYPDLTGILCSQLSKLISFDKFLCVRIGELGHQLSTFDAVFWRETRDNYEEALQDVKSGDFWCKYIQSPWSSVYRITDVQAVNDWEHSYLYRFVYAPQELYYAMQMVLVHEQQKLGAICLYRRKESGDFNEKDLNIMDLLKPHLALKLFRLLNREKGFTLEPDPLAPQFIFSQASALKFSLTRREEEIVGRLLIGESDPEICQNLCITKSTLEKHIHNIYKKTGAHSRITLFQKFKA